MLKVQDFITSEVISVAPSAPVIEVAQQMLAFGRGVIPVCDNGKFRGVVTERDLVRLLATGCDPVTEPASSVMSNHPSIVSPGADIMEAVKVMLNNGAWVLLVVQNGKLLGLLTLDDLARESLTLATVLAAVASLE